MSHLSSMVNSFRRILCDFFLLRYIACSGAAMSCLYDILAKLVSIERWLMFVPSMSSRVFGLTIYDLMGNCKR